MRTWVTVLAATALSLSAMPRAFGCSCDGTPSVEEALAEASEVFLAQATYVTHLAVEGDEDRWGYTEVAAFRVLEVWKGPLKRGDTIQALGWYGPGGCGARVADSPKRPFPRGELSRAAPYRRPGLWVIYRYGGSPYRLSVCARTKSFDMGGDREAAELRKLTQR